MTDYLETGKKSHPMNAALRSARKARGWTQVELARRSGLRQNVISSIERGTNPNPASRIVGRLARVLGADPFLLVPIAFDPAEPELPLEGERRSAERRDEDRRNGVDRRRDQVPA